MSTATDRAASLRFFRPWMGGIQPPPTGTVGPYQRAIVCAAYLLTSVIAPSSIASAEAFGTPAVSVAGGIEYLLQEDGTSKITIEDGSGFLLLESSVEATQVSPDAIASAEAFGTPVVAGPITVTSIDSAEAVGIPVLTTGAVTVSPTSIDSEEAFGTAVVAGPITATSIDSAEAFAQNAAELARDDRYAATVDAIAQEQVWFDGGAGNVPPGVCPLPRLDSDVESDAY